MICYLNLYEDISANFCSNLAQKSKTVLNNSKGYRSSHPFNHVAQKFANGKVVPFLKGYLLIIGSAHLISIFIFGYLNFPKSLLMFFRSQIFVMQLTTLYCIVTGETAPLVGTASPTPMQLKGHLA